ncbi:MFS transporter [Streptomyces sp. NPDC006475]|uniref:MFS transporter n=1 Tax=Streptomyces sp. NPDC006475 TaxID=3155719 RepID=UPI0033AE56FF
MKTSTKSVSLFRDRSFALLWTSQSISLLGTQITFVALPLTAVLVLDATPMESGILAALEQLPFLLFGLFVGVMLDRRSRRPILIAANAVRSVALAWIPIAYWLDILTIGQVFAVAFVIGTMSVFFDLAYQSYVPGLVGRERLMEANGKLQVSESVAEVAGPGTAGALISVLSAPVVLIADAMSYVFSTVALMWMPADEPPARSVESDKPTPSVWTSIREGVSVISRHPVLRWCTVAAVATALFYSTVMAVFFLFLIRESGIGPTGVGLIIAVGSAGALCGALLVDRLSRWLGVGLTLVLSLVLPGVGYLVLSNVHGNSAAAVATVAAANFVALFGIPVFDVTVISFRQVMAPDHLLGRVNATVRTFAWGALSLGALLGGVLGTTLGLRQTVLVGAMGLLLPSLILFLSPVRKVRQLDQYTAAVSAPEPDLSSL